MEKSKLIISLLAIVTTVSGLVLVFFKKEPAKTVNFNSVDSNNQKIDQGSGTTIELQKLAVLQDKCIGCGKCSRIDAEHFEYNPTINKAMVVSATNLSSPNLAAAMRTCPVGAITLE
jgi:ferredoxin